VGPLTVMAGVATAAQVISQAGPPVIALVESLFRRKPSGEKRGPEKTAAAEAALRAVLDLKGSAGELVDNASPEQLRAAVAGLVAANQPTLAKIAAGSDPVLSLYSTDNLLRFMVTRSLQP
jgi:hypothetical protein